MTAPTAPKPPPDRPRGSVDPPNSSTAPTAPLPRRGGGRTGGVGRGDQQHQEDPTAPAGAVEPSSSSRNATQPSAAVLAERRASSRVALEVLCRKCGELVVRGNTSPPMATAVVVDPRPLSSLGEVLAIARDGRTTFDLARRGGRLEVEMRDSWHIAGSPADRPDHWRRNSDVVAEHKCNTAPLDYRETRIQ